MRIILSRLKGTAMSSGSLRPPTSLHDDGPQQGVGLSINSHTPPYQRKYLPELPVSGSSGRRALAIYVLPSTGRQTKIPFTWARDAPPRQFFFLFLLSKKGSNPPPNSIHAARIPPPSITKVHIPQIRDRTRPHPLFPQSHILKTLCDSLRGPGCTSQKSFYRWN